MRADCVSRLPGRETGCRRATLGPRANKRTIPRALVHLVAWGGKTGSARSSAFERARTMRRRARGQRPRARRASRFATASTPRRGRARGSTNRPGASDASDGASSRCAVQCTRAPTDGDPSGLPCMGRRIRGPPCRPSRSRAGVVYGAPAGRSRTWDAFAYTRTKPARSSGGTSSGFASTSVSGVRGRRCARRRTSTSRSR